MLSMADKTCGLTAACFLLVFTALHGMQTRSSDEKAVRLSVRPSVCLSVRQTRGL